MLAIPQHRLSPDDWLAVAEAVGQEVELDHSAHASGALLRRRGVTQARHLLCLALLHGPGRMPLRRIVSSAARHGLGQLTEPALFRRLSRCDVWLGVVAHGLLRQRLAGLAGSPRTAASQDAQADAGLAFITAFTPWPIAMFNEAQIHLLLCLRWTAISTRLRSALSAEKAANRSEMCRALGETRNAALLIGAIMRPDA
jgi:hypothetical protein